MSRLYMGRRYREQVAAMNHALAENRERAAAAMPAILAEVEAAGRAAGAAIAETRKPPVVPGRRIRPVGDPLVEAVVRAIPGAKCVGVVSHVPVSLLPVVRKLTLDEWFAKHEADAKRARAAGLVFCGIFRARAPKHQPPKEYPIIHTMPRPRPAVG